MKDVLPKEYRYEEVDSTMDEAKRLILSCKITETSYVIADYQSKGRGTRGRKWDSPKSSGIFLSIIHSNGSMELTTLYTLASGVACIESLKEVCNISAAIKPINDIYFEVKKLGGILVESKLKKNEIVYLITGIGINTKKTERVLDRQEIEPVSIEEVLSPELYKSFSEEKLIKTIVNKVNYWYSFIFNNEHLKIQNQWNSFVVKK